MRLTSARRAGCLLVARLLAWRGALVLRAFTALAAGAVSLPLMITLFAAAGPVPQAGADAGLAGTPSALARSDIPPDYVTWYLDAAQTCPGLPWSVLAGIGKVESDHGRSQLPGVAYGRNSAGAEGPMQFEPATFTRYAVNADPVQPVSPYDPADAIYTAAAMLCADGARSGTRAGIQQAVFAYNHAGWYVTDVLAWAARYAAPTQVTASGAVATAIAFAEAQLGKPYCWGGVGPGCFDCSGLVFAAYGAAGIQLARTTYQWQQDGPQIPLADIEPGDLLFSAGSDGTTSNPGHVVMYLGSGRVIQSPQTGQDIQTDPLDTASVVVATRPAALQGPPVGTHF